MNVFPEDGIAQDLIIFVDGISDESSTTTKHNPIVNTFLTVSIIQRQGLESNYIQNRVSEIQQLLSSSSQLSSQEYTSIGVRLYYLQTGTGANEINWPQVGYQPLNEYTTEILMVMCFP